MSTGLMCSEEGCWNLSFSRSADLRRHKAENHASLWRCPYCSWAGSKRESRYREHMNKYHETIDVVLNVPNGFAAYAAATSSLDSASTLTNKNAPILSHPNITIGGDSVFGEFLRNTQPSQNPTNVVNDNNDWDAILAGRFERPPTPIEIERRFDAGRGENYNARSRSAGPSSRYEEKTSLASTYQEEEAGQSIPLTADMLRKQQGRKRKRDSSRSARSGSGDESDNKSSSTTRATRAKQHRSDNSNENENIRIRVTGKARVMVGGTHIDCNDGGEISISRAQSYQNPNSSSDITPSKTNEHSSLRNRKPLRSGVISTIRSDHGQIDEAEVVSEQHPGAKHSPRNEAAPSQDFTSSTSTSGQSPYVEPDLSYYSPQKSHLHNDDFLHQTYAQHNLWSDNGSGNGYGNAQMNCRVNMSQVQSFVDTMYEPGTDEGFIDMHNSLSTSKGDAHYPSEIHTHSNSYSEEHSHSQGQGDGTYRNEASNSNDENSIFGRKYVPLDEEHEVEPGQDQTNTDLREEVTTTYTNAWLTRIANNKDEEHTIPPANPKDNVGKSNMESLVAVDITHTPSFSQSPMMLRQRWSRASSVSSDNASIFSAGSNSSWQSSIYDALGAAGEFRMILLHDAELKPVFNFARDNIDIHTFKVELHRMLRNYSQDLLKEARVPVEKTAIQFVRKFRRRIAYQVGDELYEDVPKLSVARPPISMPHHISEGENDSSEDQDDEDGGDFQRMKDFLLNSLAFKTFKIQLVLSLKSSLEPFMDASKLVAGETVGFENGVIDDSIIQTEDACAVGQDLYLNNMKHAAEIKKSSAEIALSLPQSTTTTQSWMFWFICISNWLYSTFLKSQRPKLEMGQRRIQWQCDCGTSLYGDFCNDDPAEVDELERSLTASETQRTTGSSATSNHVIALTTMPTSASITSTTTTLNEQLPNAPNQNCPLATLHGKLNPSDPPASFQSPKYIALCINKGEYYIALGEIEVSSITSDKEIFEQIRRKYLELRSFRSRALRLFLIHPTDINFVHFAVEDSHRVDIISHIHPENYPPKTEVDSHRYEYTPCPLKSAPAISANAFLHYMSCTHSEASLSRGTKWLNRLPKRLITGLEETRRKSGTEIDVEGWGIHIIEGPNLAAMTLLTSCFVLLCGVSSAIYAVMMKDVSGGFALGAFVVAAWTSWMATLFFQWRKQ